MGLITAAINAVTGTLESQWKEYFYCDAMPESVLATKAMKKKKSAFGFKVEDENVISQGSVTSSKSERYGSSSHGDATALQRSRNGSPVSL